MMRFHSYYDALDNIEKTAKQAKRSALEEKSECKLDSIELSVKGMHKAINAIYIESGIALEKKIIDLV